MINKIIPAVRTENITYAVRDIVVLANQVAKTGKEMLYLNIGDPNLYDFAPPKHLVDATYQAMLKNLNGYAPSSGINEAIKTTDNEERIQRLNKLSMIIKQKMSFPQEKKEFYMQIEEIHKDFHLKLKTSFPDLTNLEKRLAGLLRLNLSTKEISTLLNISPKSVEVARYRLKKKMNLDKDKTLNNFINNL